MMAILESDVNMLETELPTNGTAFFVGRINAAGHAVIKVNVVTVVTDKAFKVASLHVNRRPEPVIAQTTQARSLLEEVFEELGIQVLAVAAEPGNRTYHAYIKVPKSMQTEEVLPSPCSRPQGHTTINENIDNTTAFNTSPCPHPPVTSPISLNQPRHPATLLIPPLFPPITKQGYVDRIVATAALKALKGPFLKVLAKSEMGDGYAMAALILDFGSITDEKCDTCQRQQVTSGILNVGTLGHPTEICHSAPGAPPVVKAVAWSFHAAAANAATAHSAAVAAEAKAAADPQDADLQAAAIAARAAADTASAAAAATHGAPQAEGQHNSQQPRPTWSPNTLNSSSHPFDSACYANGETGCAGDQQPWMNTRRSPTPKRSRSPTPGDTSTTVLDVSPLHLTRPSINQHASEPNDSTRSHRAAAPSPTEDTSLSYDISTRRARVPPRHINGARHVPPFKPVRCPLIIAAPSSGVVADINIGSRRGIFT